MTNKRRVANKVTILERYDTNIFEIQGLVLTKTRKLEQQMQK